MTQHHTFDAATITEGTLDEVILAYLREGIAEDAALKAASDGAVTETVDPELDKTQPIPFGQVPGAAPALPVETDDETTTRVEIASIVPVAFDDAETTYVPTGDPQRDAGKVA